MALVTGFSLCAATASGVALAASCQSQLEPLTADLLEKNQLSSKAALLEKFKFPLLAGLVRLATQTSKASPAPQPATTQEDTAASTWQGFSMEEARNLADASHEQVKVKKPSEVLEELQRGNARFWTGRANRPESSAFQRRALISKQFPTVAVLGCSDSRVPTELVFDQGLGDLFVIRVAGNSLATTTAASLQYAVHHLKVKVLVVLGHELCGAVKAAQLPDETLNGEPEDLAMALKSIKAGLSAANLKDIHDPRALDREAVTTNVRHQLAVLKQDKGIMSKVQTGELLVTGGFYEISSGIVDFFGQVSP